MNATDQRLSDNRVKSARHATWLISDDPTPDYSPLDNRDGLHADIVLPQPVRETTLRNNTPVIPEPPHTMFEAMRVLFWMVAIGVPAVVVFTVGFMVGRWVA